MKNELKSQRFLYPFSFHYNGFEATFQYLIIEIEDVH